MKKNHVCNVKSQRTLRVTSGCRENKEQCSVEYIAVVYSLEMLDFFLFHPPMPGSDPDS